MSVSLRFLLFLLCFLGLTAQFKPPKLDQLKPLNPSDAFQFQWEQNGDQITLIWNIEKEYYLYHDKFSVVPSQDMKIMNQVISEPTSIISDDYFGTQPIHEKQAYVKLTARSQSSSTKPKLTVTYQGCWKKGICYPPQKKIVDLSPLNS